VDAVGLQHRVETATRCASVSDAAIAAKAGHDPDALLRHEQPYRRCEPRLKGSELRGIELMRRGRAVLDFFRYGRNLCFAFEPSL
jgi:hypothetical protein